MPDRKVTATINISKAIAEVTLSTVAAIGGASGNPMMTGLAALPAAGLVASDAIGAQVAQLRSKQQKEELLELLMPSWWNSDSRSWVDLCAEIDRHLPKMLEDMAERMQSAQEVVTTTVIQQTFIEILTTHYLTWAPTVKEERRKVARYVAKPILRRVDKALKLLIEQIQRENFLLDNRKVALNSEKSGKVLEQILDAIKPTSLIERQIDILQHLYCEAVYEQWKMLDFRGIMHTDMNRPIKNASNRDLRLSRCSCGCSRV